MMPEYALPIGDPSQAYDSLRSDGRMASGIRVRLIGKNGPRAAHLGCVLAWVVVCCIATESDARRARVSRPNPKVARRITWAFGGVVAATTLTMLWPSGASPKSLVTRGTPRTAMDTTHVMHSAERDHALVSAHAAERAPVMAAPAAKPKAWRLVWRKVTNAGIADWEHEAPIPGVATISHVTPQRVDFTDGSVAFRAGCALQGRLDKRHAKTRRGRARKSVALYPTEIQLGVLHDEVVTPIPLAADAPALRRLERHLVMELADQLYSLLREMGGEKREIQLGPAGTLSSLPIGLVRSRTHGLLTAVEYDRLHTTVSADTLAVDVGAALALDASALASEGRSVWADGLERLARINGHEFQFAQPLQDLRSIGDRAQTMLAR